MRDGIQVNRNKVIRPVVLPSELMMLKAGEGFINFAGFKPAKFKFANYKFDKIAPGYIENKQLMDLFTKELELGEKRRKEIEAKLLADINDDSDDCDNKEIFQIKPIKFKQKSKIKQKEIQKKNLQNQQNHQHKNKEE